MAVVKKNDLSQLFAVEMHNKSILEKKPDARYILIVDENKVRRDAILAQLEEKYAVLLAVNGNQALEIMRVRNVDAVLAAFETAHSGAEGLIARVRADVTIKDIPIVLLTAQERRIEALTEGANDCIGAPFASEEVQLRVRNLLRSRAYQLRLENELRSARKIQQALLPAQRTDFVGGNFEFLFLPCEELSGDFLDLIPLSNGFFIYVADVTSHGAAAAQVTYLVKSLVREAVRSEGEKLTPAELISILDRRFSEFKLDYWVGITAIKFNVETREVIVAQTNSPMPLLVSGEKAQMIMSEPVPVIGHDLITLELDKVNTRLTLKPSEAIYVFTDGAFEFRVDAADRNFGERQLFRLLKSAHGDNWRNLVEAGLRRALGKADFPDDVSIGRLAIL